MRALWPLLCLWAGAAQAHEFWIDPQAWQIAPDSPVVADIRVGDGFEGAAFSFLPPNFQRFEIWHDGEVTEVAGRPGDRPALNMALPGEGLAILVHETRAYRLTYPDRATFDRFCAHKDVTALCATHDARGLDPDTVRETYTRYAKSLVAIGAGQGADQEVGLLTEIIAEANPYTDDVTAGLPLRVLFDGAPRVDAQVELFDKAPDGQVTTRLYRTDAAGRVMVTVTPGHSYLADAVILRPRDPSEAPDGKGPAWESLWASLTFAVPD